MPIKFSIYPHFEGTIHLHKASGLWFVDTLFIDGYEITADADIARFVLNHVEQLQWIVTNSMDNSNAG